MGRNALIHSTLIFMLEPLEAINPGHSNQDTAGLKPRLQRNLDRTGGGTLVPRYRGWNAPEDGALASQNHTRDCDLFSAPLGLTCLTFYPVRTSSPAKTCPARVRESPALPPPTRLQDSTNGSIRETPQAG